MAHTLDTSAQIALTTANPITQNYTCGSGTTLLVVMVLTGGATRRTANSVSYDTVPMIEGGIRVHGTGPETYVEFYYMINPPTGSAKTVSITNAGTLNVAAVVASFKAATGYSSVFKTVKVNSGVSTNPTSLAQGTMAAGDLTVGWVGSGADTWAPTARKGTVIYTADLGTYGYTAHYFVSTDTSAVTMNQTFATSDDWAYISCDFAEIACDGAVTIYPKESADDGHVFTTTIANNTATVIFGKVSTVAYNAWFRLSERGAGNVGVTIPKNANILRANVYHHTDTANSTSCVTNMYMNDIDNAVNPTTVAEYNALAVGSATAWTVASFVVGNTYVSPDIKAIIQPIVNRAGWAAGNYMMLLQKDSSSATGGNRQARSFDYSYRDVSQVVIYYNLLKTKEPTLTTARASATNVKQIKKNVIA